METKDQVRQVVRQYFAGTLPADEAMQVHRRLVDDEAFFRAAVPVLSREVFKTRRGKTLRGRKQAHHRPVRALRLMEGKR